MAEAVLRAEGVGYRLGARALVADVALELHTGEVLGLIGPNGAGKSTLLRLMAGLLRPTAGALHLHGRALDSFPARERARRIGYLPQHFAPHWDYTARELLRLGLERGGDPSGLEAVATRHDITALLPRRWSSLSGGERARVLAASVLATRPELVLADEATAALDVGQSLALMRRLRAAAQAGAAVAVVVHDLNLAVAWCDRIALLHQGRLQALATAPALAEDPRLDAVFGVVFERVRTQAGWMLNARARRCEGDREPP
ncbi:ABC transporter ATP-binding protein [Falsiroseomonas sp.]|uniref:ABC transporter ATP-binding protein n=1 Tax=Falsiroseomonas sp. TaxID=2870721 RepID=UPI002736FAFB|nr:ABC transporter ATP-binding protein [Falsiroseomonas sp.]MDP3418043.1 ABC transporter ATP-binding protein [Falsiroseomonas sp.]